MTLANSLVALAEISTISAMVRQTISTNRKKLKTMPLTWTHSPKNNRIIHQNINELEIIFTTCVFRADHILEKVGSLVAFQELMDLELITNGPLVLAREMNSPAIHLEHRIVERLYPLGFEYKKDFVFMEEQLIYGVGNRVTELLNQPLTENADIDWLGSVVRLDGNFVWWDG
jgi:hypothetical protein